MNGERALKQQKKNENYFERKFSRRQCWQWGQPAMSLYRIASSTSHLLAVRCESTTWITISFRNLICLFSKHTVISCSCMICDTNIDQSAFNTFSNATCCCCRWWWCWRSLESCVSFQPFKWRFSSRLMPSALSLYLCLLMCFFD